MYVLPQIVSMCFFQCLPCTEGLEAFAHASALSMEFPVNIAQIRICDPWRVLVSSAVEFHSLRCGDPSALH